MRLVSCRATAVQLAVAVPLLMSDRIEAACMVCKHM